MQFFRVEKVNGQGPYRGTGGDVNVLDYLTQTPAWDSVYDRNWAEYMDVHPGPHTDEILADLWYALPDQEDYIFGFDSLDQLFAWFSLPEEIAFFKSRHFIVSIYESDACVYGKRQAVMDKEHPSTKLIERLDF